MQVKLNANMVDSETDRIASMLRDPFDLVEGDLSKDYGGTIEHLWIDFELIQHYAELRLPHSFRFQKRVSGNDRLTGIRHPDCYNVGHYSVRPDFKLLLSLPTNKVPVYALKLIYESTEVLLDKRRKLGGFDAERFRAEFLAACERRGHKITGQIHFARPSRIQVLKQRLFGK